MSKPQPAPPDLLALLREAFDALRLAGHVCDRAFELMNEIGRSNARPLLNTEVLTLLSQIGAVAHTEERRASGCGHSLYHAGGVTIGEAWQKEVIANGRRALDELRTSLCTCSGCNAEREQEAPEAEAMGAQLLAGLVKTAPPACSEGGP